MKPNEARVIYHLSVRYLCLNGHNSVSDKYTSKNCTYFPLETKCEVTLKGNILARYQSIWL